MCKINFSLKKCSTTKISKHLQTMFYMHYAGDHRIAFVNKHLVGFLNIQPAKLSEISFWACQVLFLNLIK